MSLMLILSSLRGGSGTTSVCAALGDALQNLGKKVLLIDLNPNDMLRLHFNVPFNDYAGWAWATTQQKGWKDYSYVITPHLHLIAYGKQGVKALRNDTAFSFPFHELATVSNQFDVILIDCPTSQRQAVSTACPTALELLITNPDPASHILLSENTPQPQQHLLINGLDPAFSLSNLLLLEWRARFSAHLIPTFLHRDNGFPESLAQKMPVTHWRPHSAAARDAHALAKWCLTQAEGARSHA